MLYHSNIIYFLVFSQNAEEQEQRISQELHPGVRCGQVRQVQDLPQEGHPQVLEEEDGQEGWGQDSHLRREEGPRIQEWRIKDGQEQEVAQ